MKYSITNGMSKEKLLNQAVFTISGYLVKNVSYRFLKDSLVVK